jgi:hypothetical protein
MPNADYDQRELRCRLLGHDVPFKYCRKVNDGTPCRFVADCWHPQFDVATYLLENYTAEQIESILTPPKPKITSLVELIERAKNSAAEE